MIPQRQDVLSSGDKINRDWWYTTKLAAMIVISAAAAYGHRNAPLKDGTALARGVVRLTNCKTSSLLQNLLRF